MQCNYHAVITLNRLRLMVNLGVGEEERESKQEVDLDFKFFFEKAPMATLSDSIEDTVCYHKVSVMVQEFCEGKFFKTLEFMCAELFSLIRQSDAVDESVKTWIKVTKCKPPIDDLLGSTSFEMSDVE